MRFLIVRTDIRAAADDDLAAAFQGGRRLRDEQTSPEPRRQVFRAEDRDAALLMARALASVGAVRSGRQRVKVLPVGEPEPCLRPSRRGPGGEPARHGQPETPSSPGTPSRSSAAPSPPSAGAGPRLN